MTGWFNGSVDFGNGVLVSNNQDVFVVTVADNGEVLRSRSYTGSGIEQGQKIAVDAADQIYVTGIFTGTSDIGSTSVDSAGGRDSFAFAANADGDVSWSFHAGSLERDDATEIAVDDGGRAYVGGSYASAELDTGAGVLLNGGQEDGFLIAYETDGTPRWSKAITSGANDSVSGIAVAPDSTILVVGRFSDTISIGETTLIPHTGTDIFLAGFAPDATELWARRYGSFANDTIRDFVLAPDGGVYMVGGNGRESDFGGGPLIPNGTDPFVVRLDRSP